MRLLAEDEYKVWRRIPLEIRTLAEDFTNPLVFAGGFVRDVIRGVEPSDLDIFVHKSDDARGIAELIGKLGHWKMFETDNAITILPLHGIPIQVISAWKWSERPEEILQMFDFTICQAMVYRRSGSKPEGHCTDEFYFDLAGKRLRYTFPPNEMSTPGGSLLRMRKFLGRGFIINIENMTKIMHRVIGQAQLRPGEMPSEKQILRVLREVDPSTFDPSTVEDEEKE